MKKKNFRLILLLLLLAFVGMQFIPVSRENPQTPAEKEFLNIATIDEVSAVNLKKACFDCHSNHVRYPWYGFVAPVSFMVAHHVNEGREKLNFSEWADYSAKKQAHKFEECVEALREGWMPLSGYVAMHSEANLSESERANLADVLEAEMNKIRSTQSDAQLHETEHAHED